MPPARTVPAGEVRLASPAGRLVLATAALSSGLAFLDSTVVNVALPAIRTGLHAGPGAQQWAVDAYLVTLSALLLLGGSLGDHLGRRRVLRVGLVGFMAASATCGLAPDVGALLVARAVQGAAGALLIPGSLAVISSSFCPEDRAAAIGAWSGLAGLSTAVGPALAGWLIDAVSWRAVFWLNLPLGLVAFWLARRVPESRDPAAGRLDVRGAAMVTVGLGAVAFGLIEAGGRPPWPALAAVVGVALLAAFVLVERVSSQPMLPLSLFGSAQFSGANLSTFAVYGGLGGATFLLMLELQQQLHYSALAAGATLLPFTLLMLAFSPSAGRLGQRVGPRLPMTVGPLVAAAGLWLLSDIGPGTHYLGGILPGVVVFGAGMTITVAPLTGAVLGSVPGPHAGLASGVNNAVARVGGLVAVAALPLLAGGSHGGSPTGAFSLSLRVAAGACALGGVAAFVTVRSGAHTTPAPHPAPSQGCGSPELLEGS